MNKPKTSKHIPGTHSPGPWKAVVDDESREDGADEILDARGIVIARVCGESEIRERLYGEKIESPGSTAGPDSLDEVDANARLIASAPDLISFVKRWREVIGGGDKPESLEGWAREFMEESAAAIAKAEATGESVAVSSWEPLPQHSDAPKADKKYCKGCRNNFYNGNNPIGVKECWSFKRARVVTRYRLSVNCPANRRSGYEKMETHDCRQDDGYVFVEKIPSHAR